MATHKRPESESKTTEEVWRSSSSSPLGGSRKAEGGRMGPQKKDSFSAVFFLVAPGGLPVREWQLPNDRC